MKKRGRGRKKKETAAMAESPSAVADPDTTKHANTDTNTANTNDADGGNENAMDSRVGASRGGEEEGTSEAVEGGGKGGNSGGAMEVEDAETKRASNGGKANGSGNGHDDGGDCEEGMDDNEDDDEEEDDEDEDGDEDEQERKVVKPITDSREITFKVRDMNDHLICKLCDGYFREAHTIMECLHTFCKVCLYNYLLTRDDRVGTLKKSDCPTCHITLTNAEPMKNHVRFDRTKQNIVDLILPQFKRNDENSRKKQTTTERKQEPAPKKQKIEKEKKIPRLYMTFLLRPFTEKGSKSKKEKKALPKPWLRTSPKITVKHLKKYLALKLGIENYDTLELTCQGEVLGTDHTLEFIKKTRWHENSELVLEFRFMQS